MERLLPFTCKQLKSALRNFGLKASGSKSELLLRIFEHLVSKDMDIAAFAESLEANKDSQENQDSQADDETQIGPEDSVSKAGTNKTSRSAKSVVVEKIADAAASRAWIENQEANLEEEMKLDFRKKKLKLGCDLAAAKAREEVLMRSNDFLEGKSGISKVGFGVNEKSKIKKPCQEKAGENNTQSELLDALVKFNVQSTIPTQKIPIFDGKPTDYFTFIRAFESTIAVKTESQEDKLFYLHQYTSGKPKSIVAACLLMSGDTGYKEARRLLKLRYGDPERIAHSYIDEVLKWPEIKRDDVESLDEFSVLLTSCRNAVSQIDYGAGELDNHTTMRKILQKLPFSIQDSWRKKNKQIKKLNRSAQFSDLVDHVVAEAEVWTDSSFGKHLFSGRKPTPEPPPRGNKSVRVALTAGKIHCWFCGDAHLVYNCTKLEEMTFNERRDALRDKRMCFSCLRQGHIASKCRNRQKCNKCNRDHPTILHREETQVEHVEQVNVNLYTNFCGRNNTSGRGCSVVPINVKAPNGNEVRTYAFLDKGSDATFCTNKLLSRLGIRSGDVVPTSLQVSTMNGECRSECSVVTGLSVGSLDDDNLYRVPPVYSVDSIPVSKSSVISNDDIRKWPHLNGVEVPSIESDICMLIGNDAPKLLEPHKFINSTEESDVHAVKTVLGWVICGGFSGFTSVSVNKIIVKIDEMDKALIESYNRDFSLVSSPELGLSVEDNQWLDLVRSGCTRTSSGKYQIPLPLRSFSDSVPDSKPMALNRSKGLKRKLLRDDEYHKQYRKSMKELFDFGFAEPAPDTCQVDRGWYIPHFGVTHPDKPGKVRVVFDCAAKVKGVSLNDLLLQGPDLNNLLINVLLRFRQGLYAYTADIERMFLQVHVPVNQRDYLRFFWWDNDELIGEPKPYRMTVHLFGACSSPSCAIFALQQAATDGVDQFETDVISTVNRNFYVDDCLRSGNSISNLIKNADGVKQLCQSGGFRLTKFASPSEEFNANFPAEELKLDKFTIINDETTNIKMLGLVWDLNKDHLNVPLLKVSVPTTKRELLSCIASIYDPLGMAAPWVLEGRIVMQELCRNHFGWDSELDGVIRGKISIWINHLNQIKSISVNRSFSVFNLDIAKSIELHVFSDASQQGFGASCYVRVINNDGMVNVGFVIGKGRVAPLKAVTVPRLELSAAVLAVRLYSIVEAALDIKFTDITFWSDSTTVLRYIRNSSVRFHTFVANRVSIIKEFTNVNQWRYVPTAVNPADDISRAKQTDRWVSGPTFLYDSMDLWPTEPTIELVAEGDPEIKREVRVTKTNNANSFLNKIVIRYSCWSRLCKTVAVLCKFIEFISCKDRSLFMGNILVNDISNAAKIIIKCVQLETFPDDYNKLVTGCQINTRSNLAKLSPMMVENVIRLGGRLISGDPNESSLMILPYKHYVTDLIIYYYHDKVGHMGSNVVLSEIREKFWVIKGHAAVRRIISKCIICRKNRGKVVGQKMADLPIDRTKSDVAPFYVTGIDCFGPFYIKHGRGQRKVYGVIFTCLSVRAVHLELADDLSSDAFINVLKRFISRRGLVRKIYCDNGTNFVGAAKELIGVLQEVNNGNVARNLLEQGIDWIFNPPGSSHFGGVWERMIRTVRGVLHPVLTSQVFTGDQLHTAFCEVEAIINSRPLSIVSADCNDVKPLTPNDLLNVGGRRLWWTPLTDSDSYSKRRWKQVQYCTEQFWTRWRKEYLLTLQVRQKWLNKHRNVKVNDVVLVVNDIVPRCHWPLGRVISVKQSSDGLVRSVKVKLADKILDRPISKLVMVLEDENNVVTV